MKTTLYYFSATGNNLSIAKKLRDRLEDATIHPISALTPIGSRIDSEVVGFIFPIYAWGMPLIVQEFIQASVFANTRYAFAISGCGGIGGNSMVVASKLLRQKGVQLNAAFLLKEPSNGINIDHSAPMHRFMSTFKGNRSHRTVEERMDEIIQVIKRRENRCLEKDSLIVNQTSNLINKMAVQMFKKMDKDFWTTDRCTGCGICEKICPRENIRMVQGKPQWQGNCEYCTACIHSCPVHAIQSGALTEGKPRYRKEGIGIDELMPPRVRR